MSSTRDVTVGNVEVAVPHGVRAEVRDGVVTLHCTAFTGSITLTPSEPLRKRSGDEGSEEDLAKRARVATPDEESASADPAAISALRTVQHDAFFRNGGGGDTLSQDSDEDEEAPAPRAITWEEACGQPPLPSPGDVSDEDAQLADDGKPPHARGTARSTSSIEGDPPSPQGEGEEDDVGGGQRVMTASAARALLMRSPGGMRSGPPSAANSASSNKHPSPGSRSVKRSVAASRCCGCTPMAASRLVRNACAASR